VVRMKLPKSTWRDDVLMLVRPTVLLAAAILVVSFEPRLSSQTMNPHPRLLIYQPGSPNTPTVASIQAKVPSSSQWAAIPGYLHAGCENYSTNNALDASTYAIGYIGALQVDPATATTYGNCAISLIKAGLADYTPTFSETFVGNGSTTVFTLANPLFYWCTACSVPDSVAVNGAANSVVSQASCSSFATQACIPQGTATLTFATAPPPGSTISVLHRYGMNDINHSGMTNNDNTRGFWTQFLLAFDWTYPLWNASDKAYLVTAFRNGAAYQLQTSQFRSQGYWKAGYGAGNNEGGGGMILFNCMVGLATYGDNPTDSNNTNAEMTLCQQYMDNAVTPGTAELSYDDDVQFFWNHFGLGGYDPEGIEYGCQDLDYILRTLISWQTANGTNYFASAFPNLLNDAANFLFHSVSPSTSTLADGANPSYFPFQFGDQQTGNQYNYPESFRIYALELQSQLSGTAQQEVRWWLDNIKPYFRNGGVTSPGSFGLYDLLYGATGWSTTNYQTAPGFPTDYYVAGMNSMISRSAWNSSASWVQFYASPMWQNHTQDATGELQLWRNGQFLVTNPKGWQNAWGAPANHSIASVNATALSTTPTSPSLSTWNGYGVVQFKSSGYPCDDAAMAAPCSAYNPTWRSKFDSTGNKYAYGSSDFTNNYISPSYDGSYGDFHSVSKVNREIIYLKPDYVFVYDRIGYQGAHNAYAKIFWQDPNTSAPGVSGNTISWTVGGQQVNINVVVPTAPVISLTKISGLGCVYSLGAENTGGGSGSGCYTTDGGAHGGGDGANIGSFRAEVSSGSSVNSENYLHAIELANSGTNSTVTKLSTIDSNHDGAQIASSTPMVAVFGKSGTLLTSATFTTTHSGTGHYGVSNLAAGSYNVTVGGSPVSGSPFTVGSDGFLYFESSSGAFSISGGNPRGASSKCDLNGDGLVNILDIQIAANQALGIQVCGNGDVNLDGACNLLDVQLVINAALGLGCGSS
jgi:hypothetical protein